MQLGNPSIDGRNSQPHTLLIWSTQAQLTRKQISPKIKNIRACSPLIWRSPSFVRFSFSLPNNLGGCSTSTSPVHAPSPSTSPRALPPIRCTPPSVSLGLAAVAGGEEQHGGDWVKKRWGAAADSSGEGARSLVIREGRTAALHMSR